MRHAPRGAARRVHRFRVIQVSIQDDHVHLIVEAPDASAPTRGPQALEIASARAAALAEVTRIEPAPRLELDG